jgi:flavin reductase (DIM6/NTAB) family NADH-FMN oxidoreductase RutF
MYERMKEHADSEAFKAAMRCFATGVTIVTTILDGTPRGFTATSFTSVSAEPPMVLVCVNRSARSHPVISRAGCFCVNILCLEQESLAVRFSSHADNPFTGVPYRTERTGAPRIEGALAFFDCSLSEEYSVGTHTIFVGSVVACANADGAPLGYFDSTYRNFNIG